MQTVGLECRLEVPQIKADVVCDENGIAQKLQQALGVLREGGGFRDHLIVNAREPSDSHGNGGLGINELDPAVDFSRAIVQNGGHFGDIGAIWWASGGLYIDDDKLQCGLTHGIYEEHGVHHERTLLNFGMMFFQHPMRSLCGVLLLCAPILSEGQVSNYEPYDDSDLLEEFERPKKLHFGMNINMGKAGGKSSVFYNGAGFGDLGDVFRELISIPERLDWNSVAGGSGNTVRNQIAQSLGVANAGGMSVATYPIDQRYDVGFGFGLRVMQRFSLESSLVLDVDVWRLKSRGAWQLNTGELPDQGQGSTDLREFGIFASEERTAISLGYRTASPIDRSMSWIFEGGGNLTATRIKDHYIEVAGNTYDLIVPIGGQVGAPGQQDLTWGIGYGGYLRIGAEAYMDAGAGLELSYRLGYDGVVIGTSDYRVLNHGLQLTWLFPPPQVAAASF